MAIEMATEKPIRKAPSRFVSLDFARGTAILLMIFVHMVKDCLDYNYLLSDPVLPNQPTIVLLVLVFVPFIGGLAGFFLLISATSNMVSMYNDLEKGNRIRDLVLKQVVGGFLLLVFAMLCEGLIGSMGAFGEFFLNLNDPAATNWQVLLYRWNHFETIHTIAWCIIINGCVQGLLSLRNNWKNRRNMIISYLVLLILIILLTQPIWTSFNNAIPGYPFGPGVFDTPMRYLAEPAIGTDFFWEILRAPFLAVFASPVEPLFPYLAVSFIGSIFGIVLSKPKNEVNRNFPSRMILVGGGMFVAGVVGILAVIYQVYIRNGMDFEYTADFYMSIIYHRFWTPDNPLYNGIPRFAWLAQFLAVTGMSIMLLMLLFRLVEFRGKSHSFAKNTKIVRRLGIVAFSNYNNQWLYYIVWEIVSLMVYQEHYRGQLWAGLALVVFLSIGLYSLLLWLWEKVNYIGSLEWFIRSFTNNVIPIRRKRFDSSTKWWQRGAIDANIMFYNADWINMRSSSSLTIGKESKETNGDILEPLSKKNNETKDDGLDTLPKKSDSKLALKLSIISLCSIIFVWFSAISLTISLRSRKEEGINKQNKAAMIISIITLVLFVAVIITLLAVPISKLGLF